MPLSPQVAQGLEELPARHVGALLEELALRAHRFAQGEALHLPRVTLLFRSGRSVEGIIVDRSQKAGYSTLVLHVASVGSSAGSDLLIAALDDIEGVIVHGASLLGQSAESEPPTGRLKLKRRAAEFAQKRAGTLGKTLEFRFSEGADDESLHAMEQLLSLCEGAFVSILSEQLGVDALRQKVSIVSFEVGEQPAVHLEGDTLHLVTVRSAPRRWAPNALREAIERVL